MERDDEPPSSARGTFLGIVLAVVVGGAAIVYCIIIMGPFFFGLLGVVTAIAILGCVHYVIWGRSLDQHVAGEREEQQQLDAEIEEYPLDEPHWPRRL